MNDIRDFKTIADEIMSDIKANDSLKDITVQRCINKRHVPIGKILATAACFILILGFVNLSGILPMDTNNIEQDNLENYTMAATNGGMETLAGQPNDSILPGTDIGTDAVTTGKDAGREWRLETLAQADILFGNGFLIPSYIPEDFKLNSIFASGSVKETAEKITINYFTGDRSFLIIQQKDNEQGEFINYSPIDINGAGGYLKSEASDENKNVILLNTELHWFKDGIHYLIAGMISDSEAVKVAMSMK